MEDLNRSRFLINGRHISYLDGGFADGPLLIFVHGWPGLAETWKPQLLRFAALGYRVIAPDAFGYGQSGDSRDERDFSLESLVGDMVGLLEQLERKDAVWIGHDWGSGIVWALAAHHPEICVGVVNLCVPYRTIEIGLKHLLPYVNRDIYPVEEYPYGQWSYQVFYEQERHKVSEYCEANLPNLIKVLYSRSNPTQFKKPARTANVVKDGGWFGGGSPPEIPMEYTVLDKEMYELLISSLSSHGFRGPNSYYLNHDINEEYGTKSVSNGVLDFPVLFIEAKFDAICDTAVSRLGEPMKEFCRNLTDVSIEAGHWVALEKSNEVNAAIEKWLIEVSPTHRSSL